MVRMFVICIKPQNTAAMCGIGGKGEKGFDGIIASTGHKAWRGGLGIKLDRANSGFSRRRGKAV